MAQNKQGKQGKITFQVPFNLAEPQEKEGYIHKRGTSSFPPFSCPAPSPLSFSFAVAARLMTLLQLGKGLGGKGYTPRYFILSGDVLYYFENKPKNGVRSPPSF